MIYLDELVLVNFAAGALFLLGAGLLTGQRCRGGRLILGAALSGAASLALLAPEQPFMPALLYKISVCAAAVAAAYGWPGPRAFGQLCVWCALLSLALTGAVLLPGVETRNLSVYLPLSPGLLLVCTGGVYLALRVFCDTGFLVEEPLSGRTVMLVRYPAVSGVLPGPLCTYLEEQLAGQPAVPPQGYGVCLVPCSTLAGQQLLPAVPVQALECRAHGRARAQNGLLAAFCTADCPPGTWTALVGEQTAARLGQ